MSHTAPHSHSPAALHVRWAQHLDEVRQAQRLRYAVFCGEMGAVMHTPLAGHDVDEFDDYCEHLLVCDADSGQVVGTYRALLPAQAQRMGRLYSDAEFDLAPLRSIRPHMVELGRSCVHSDYRGGGVVLALWSALAVFMEKHQLSTMIGCASIAMHHGGLPEGYAAARIWQALECSNYMADTQYHVQPYTPLPIRCILAETSGDLPVTVEYPALLKGYLRLGACVLGAPAWDKEFHTADLPVMLRLQDISPRYRRLLVNSV